jgi:hypothetical protein
MRLRSHQLRHYLNHLARLGGMSELDIAKWSGRKDIRQNAAYDHMSSRDVIELARKAIGEEYGMHGSVVVGDRKAVLITRDEFGALQVPTAHTTDFGYCIHDFAMLPCQLYQDCLNCLEHICIKGDAECEARVRRRRAELADLARRSEAAEADGEYGAGHWVQRDRRHLQTLNDLCALLDDPSGPDGSVIRPARTPPASRLEQAATRRGHYSIESHDAGAAASVATLVQETK